jgi:hypothetical protein
MCRAPPTTWESGKNAFGQEAFGRKLQGTPVVELSAASAADVTSTTGGAGATVASDADKAGTSAPPTIEGAGGDLCTTGPQLAVGPAGGHGGGYTVGGRPTPVPLHRHPMGGGGRRQSP